MRKPVSPLRFLWIWCRRQLLIQKNMRGFLLSSLWKKKNKSDNEAQTARPARVGNASRKKPLKSVVLFLIVVSYLWTTFFYSFIVTTKLDQIIPHPSIAESVEAGQPIEITPHGYTDFKSKLRIIDQISADRSQQSIEGLSTEERRQAAYKTYLSPALDSNGEAIFRSEAENIIEQIYSSTSSIDRPLTSDDAEFIFKQLINKGMAGFVVTSNPVTFTTSRATELLSWLGLYFLMAIFALTAMEGVANSNPLMRGPEDQLLELAFFPIPTWTLFLIPLLKRSLLNPITLLFGFAPTTLVFIELGFGIPQAILFTLPILFSFVLCVASAQVCYQFVGRYSQSALARWLARWLQLPGYVIFCMLIFVGQLTTLMEILRPVVISGIGNYLPPSLLSRALYTNDPIGWILPITLSLWTPVCSLIFIRVFSRGGLPIPITLSSSRGSRRGKPAASKLSAPVLRLMRDRGYFMQTILMPAILFAFYSMIILENGNTLPSEAALGMIFGACIFIMLGSLINLAAHEGPGLWILYCSSHPVSKVIQQRIESWIKLTLAIAILAMAGAEYINPQETQWTYMISLLLGIPSLCYIAAATSFSAIPPTVGSEVVKPQTSRIYLFLLIATMYPQVALLGVPGAQYTAPILFGLLALAFWQECKRQLPIYFDPDKKPTPELTLKNSMLWCMCFLWLQSLVYMVIVAVAGIEISLPAQVASYTGSALITALLAAHWYSKRQLHRLPRAEVTNNKYGLAVIGWTALLLGFASIYLQLLRHYFPAFANSELSGQDRIWLLLLAVIVAPPLEEYLFRRLLLVGLLRTLSPRLALLMGAATFAAIHPLASFAPVFCLGLVCGWLYWKSGRLWIPIAVHALYNCGVVLLQ